MTHIRTFLMLTLFSVLSMNAMAAEVCVVDDKQRDVCLAGPAQRIAALSPGATELIYAAGAGDQVVAVVSYSDYPPEAQKVTSVGSHTRIDLERLISLQPDLVLAWGNGNPSEQIETIQRIGIPVYYVEPHEFDDISKNLINLATLAGTQATGRAQAKRFDEGITDLKQRYAGVAPINTFYQVWDTPLMTMNGQHYISKVVSLCGGVNVFAEAARLIPRLTHEAVLLRNPEVIVAGGMGERNDHWLEHWRLYSELLATQQNNLFFVPPSLIQRPTPRLLQGAEILCEKLDQARAKRSK